MAALHLLDQGDRPQPGLGFEHRADLGVPEPGEGVGTLAAKTLAGDLRREMPSRLDPASGALAEAGFGGGNALGMVVTEVHE
jgi:hypothetical protein